MLRHAPPGLGAGHEQQPVDPRERRGQRARLVVVAVAHLDAPVGEVGDRGGVAHDRDDVTGRHPPVEQVGDDEAAEAAGGTGDGESGHGELLGGGEGGGRRCRRPSALTHG